MAPTLRTSATAICIVCDSAIWLSLVPGSFDSKDTLDTPNDTPNDTRNNDTQHALFNTLDASQHFLRAVAAASPTCARCRDAQLVALVGASGSGKSALLNVAAGCTPTSRFVSSGAQEIAFANEVSRVSALAASTTQFPVFFRRGLLLFADCPGFGDNRGGALEFLQSCVLKRILERQNTKVVLVKSLNADRDMSFLHMLDSGLMTPSSCMLVLTKAKPKASTQWHDYLDASVDPALKLRLQKKFASPHSLPCVKMLQPEFYQNLQRDLSSTFLPSFHSALSKLTPCAPLSMIDASPTIQKFAHDSIKLLRSLIEIELSVRLELSFLTYQFQPYNISIIKTLLCSTFATPEPIVRAFRMLGMLEDSDDDSDNQQDLLTKYVNYWALFHDAKLVQEESLTCGNFIHPTITSKLSLTTSTPLSLRIEIPPDMPLHAKLLLWTETRETFHLEYVSYKGQLQVLLAKASRAGDRHGVAVSEAKRLIAYRLERCGCMEEAWCHVARALQQVMNKPREESDASRRNGDEMEMDMLSQGGTPFPKEKDWDFEFLGKLMDEHALRELLKLGLENRGSIGNMIMLLGGVGATGAAAAIEGVTGMIAGGASRAGVAIELGSSAVMVAGTLATVLAVAAVANFVYVRGQQQKQLNEGGVIGLDFSEYGLEKVVWKTALEYLEGCAEPEEVSAAIIKIDSLFRVYEEKFSWDLVQKRRLIDVRFSEMKDTPQDSNDTKSIVKSWVNVVSTNQKLMHSIISKLKGRAKSVSGCSFLEHSLVEEFRFFPVTAACCRYLSPSGAKRCTHCNSYFHDSPSNKQCLVESRAVLCKDRMGNPDQNKSTSVQVFFYDDKSFPVVEWSRLPSTQKRTAIHLSSAIYSSPSQKLHNMTTTLHKPHNILYSITLLNSIAYVVFRGTEPTSTQNWLTNATFALTEYSSCTFHSGYFRICQDLLDPIWQRILDLSCTQVVFTGHSLGGSLAHTLHLLCLLTKFETTTLPLISIGFGSPPPFGKKTLDFFQENGIHGRFITFANQGDPVPMAMKAVEFFERKVLTSSPVSPDVKTALQVAAFVPKIMSAAYAYCGTYVFFEGGGKLGGGEQAVLGTHEAVERWMGLTRLEDCAVERHGVGFYERFVEDWYPV
ncbi:hypothetical protein HDU98_005856 [Podochytrium sp. JEL0797]|nr:hypothetical protein HDU98_005856 [Podochytrium sp. JEL0797]